MILTRGQGLLPPDHACLVGVPPHVPEAGELWDEADVVVAMGTDLDGMMTQAWKQPQPPQLVATTWTRRRLEELRARSGGRGRRPEASAALAERWGSEPGSLAERRERT